MKRLLVVIVALFLLQFAEAGEQNDSISGLQKFIDANPMCWSKNVVYKGTNVLLCSDGELLFIQLKVLHPAFQMRLLMQGVTFYVDPTGRKKEKYSIILPSAYDVREQMQGLEPRRQVEARNGEEQRPDIRPLVNALTNYGAIFDINGQYSFVDKGCFAINLSEKDIALVYTILVPINQMMEEKKLSDKWRLGIYSQGGNREKDGPGCMPMPNQGRPGMPPNGNDKMQMTDDNDMQDLLIKDIEEWISFSLSTICSMNN